jgi:transcriptional regulator with XRE-family HTH domain
MSFGTEPPSPQSANEWVKANVQEAMDLRKWKQVDLAQRLGRSQPWLSKRLTGKTPFQIKDLDALARAFGFAASDLLCAGYGKWDRRQGQDRRSGFDRRRVAVHPFPHGEIPRRQLTDREGAA